MVVYTLLKQKLLMDRDSCLTLYSPPVHFLVRHVRLQSDHFQNQFPQLHCSVFHQQANAALRSFKYSSSYRTDCSSGKALNLYFGGSWLESRRNTSCPDRAFIFLSPSDEFLITSIFIVVTPLSSSLSPNKIKILA